MVGLKLILAVGAVHGLYVFFRALQQQNVMFLQYWWAVLIGYAISGTEVFMVSVVAISAVNAEAWIDLWPIALSMGTGSALGAVAAMFIHSRYIKKVRVL